MSRFLDLCQLQLADEVKAGDVIPIPLFPIGEWKSAKYPKLSLTRQLADDLIANFEAGILGTEPVLDSSGRHDTSAPAAGWFKRLHLDPLKGGGEMLFGDCELTDLGAQALNEGLYKYDSIEIDSVTQNASGEVVPNVFKSATLTNTPVLRMLPPVLEAGDAIAVALSEVTAAEEDPVANLCDKIDALLGELSTTLKGKAGIPAIRTMMREVRTKAAAHSLSEDDGNPAGTHPASSEPSSHPAKGDEGQPVALAEGDAATKGADSKMKTVIQKLNLDENAGEADVFAAVVKLSEERDSEKARADTAELKLAETEKASSIAAFTVKLDEKIKTEATIAPGEREHYMKLAERDVELAEGEIAHRTHKVIDTTEHGSGKRGSAGDDKRADVELAEKVRARISKDGCDYATATSLVLSEDPDLKTRYDEFRAGKEG
jgi:hypothetical protein